MRELLILSIPILLAIGCAPSASEILAAGGWSHTARLACKTPGACPAERACISSVVAATRLGAGRAEYKAAQTACKAYGATP